MLCRRISVCTASLVVLAGLALGQTRPAVDSAAATQGDLKISLMDGSIVTGKFSVNELAINTRFGSLKVPIDQIVSFAPGLQSHPAFSKNLDELVTDLGADSFADRDKAQAALMKLGPDLRGELERRLKTAEAERQMRLQKILDDFEAQQSGDEVDKSRWWVNEDVIVTPGFTVVGKITTPGFSVSNQYGKLDLKMEDIRDARRDAAEPEEIHKNVSITGTAISQHAWTTAVRLNKGDKVYITASGTIQMTPWGGNMAATPDGGGNFGVMQPGNLPGGSLIGRINDGGTPMRIGSKATFTADKAGLLQFGIAVPGDYSSYQFPGEYSVKVRVVKK